MKVWIIETEIMSTYDEWSPQTFSTSIEKMFDTLDKAISYVRNSIKNAIDEQQKEPDRDVKWIIDHVPTDEEILDSHGCWYKTVDEVGTDDYAYYIREYDVE